MTWFHALVLGVVQGLTEFIPVSSSAHLVLVPWVAGWTFDPAAAFVFDVLVQLGTLVAVVVYFWRDLVAFVGAVLRGLRDRKPFEDPNARLAWLLVLATVPAVIAGLLFKSAVESAFSHPAAVSGFLLITAAILFIAERVGKKVRSLADLRAPDAWWIGLAQAVALLPGVSRSGATIGAGLVRGMDRPAAARFSFLMSVPVMIGAGLVAAKDLLQMTDVLKQVGPLLVGFVAAAVVGYLSIRWLLGYLARRPLTVFAVYCTLVGVAGLLLAWLRG